MYIYIYFYMYTFEQCVYIYMCVCVQYVLCSWQPEALAAASANVHEFYCSKEEKTDP